MADKREIKFRGKRDADGEWTYGWLVIENNSKKMPVTAWISRLYHRGEWEQVDPKTVGQFTGLRDKHGKGLYEGDYLACRKYVGGNFVDYAHERGSVGFKNGAFYLIRKEGYYRPLDWIIDYEFEVISNIYEHPELLEVANNG